MLSRTWRAFSVPSVTTGAVLSPGYFVWCVLGLCVLVWYARLMRSHLHPFYIGSMLNETNVSSQKVSFDAVKEFVDENGATQTEMIPPQVIFLNRTDTSYTLHRLSPFTTYKVNVSAVPPMREYRPPASIYVTTKMHGSSHAHVFFAASLIHYVTVYGISTAPSPLATPKLYGVTQSGTIMVVSPQASERLGPISHSFLVVIPESHAANFSDSNAYHIFHDVSLFLHQPYIRPLEEKDTD